MTLAAVAALAAANAPPHSGKQLPLVRKLDKDRMPALRTPSDYRTQMSFMS